MGLGPPVNEKIFSKKKKEKKLFSQSCNNPVSKLLLIGVVLLKTHSS